MEQEIEIVLIGGGPAAASAAVYAARKKLNAVLVAREFGGQSVVSPDIKNWIGTPSISGADLAKSLKAHVKEYEGDTFRVMEDGAVSVSKDGDMFVTTLESGTTLRSKALFIGTGATRRTLDVKGAAEYEHKGLTYCASCDGPLFTGQDVAVIGGGNAGFETAAQLLAYTKSVTLLHRGADYRADKITVDKVLAHPNMTGVLNAQTKEVFGETFVKGLMYEKDGKEETLNVSGIFVEIGLIPETSLVKDLVDLDEIGRVVVDPKTQQSSEKYIWAAGDCSNGVFHQNNIAAGDAVKAMEHAYITLRA